MDVQVLYPAVRRTPSLIPRDPNSLFRTGAPPRTVALRRASVSSGGPAPTGEGGAASSAPDGGGGKAASPTDNSGVGAADKAGARPLKIRYRSMSRKQARQQEQRDGGAARPAAAAPPPPKAWEEMTLAEKAVELYVGEKGLLFWLNKLAYASIFAVVGGWILFRFVGPSLGLYQLDTSPLAPSALFKG